MRERVGFIAVVLAAALAPLSAQAPEASIGVGYLAPGRQTISVAGKPDQDMRIYQGGPVLDLGVHFLKGRWLEPRVRATGFFLDKGDATLQDGTAVDARAYGGMLVVEGQLHLWKPGRPGPYLTFGGGGLYYHYAINGFLGAPVRVSGDDAGVTGTVGAGLQLGAGWETEVRYDGHLTTHESAVFPVLLYDVDPNPSGLAFVVRKRFGAESD